LGVLVWCPVQDGFSESWKRPRREGIAAIWLIGFASSLNGHKMEKVILEIQISWRVILAEMVEIL